MGIGMVRLERNCLLQGMLDLAPETLRQRLDDRNTLTVAAQRLGMKVPGIGQRPGAFGQSFRAARRLKKQVELGLFALFQVGGVDVCGLVGDIVTDQADGETELHGFGKIAAMIGAPCILKRYRSRIDRLVRHCELRMARDQLLQACRVEIRFAIALMQTRPVRF